MKSFCLRKPEKSTPHVWSVLRIAEEPSFAVRITDTVNIIILLNVVAQKHISMPEILKSVMSKESVRRDFLKRLSGVSTGILDS